MPALIAARVLVTVATRSLGVLFVLLACAAMPSSGMAVESNWSIVTSPNAAASQTPNVLNGTTCVSATDCWAVGYYLAGNTQQSLIERWNGTAWSLSPRPTQVRRRTTLLTP